MRKAVPCLIAAACVVTASPAAADEIPPPTTVAGLLLAYRDLSRQAEQASERVLVLDGRAAGAHAQAVVYGGHLAGLVARAHPVRAGADDRLLGERIDRLRLRAADVGVTARRLEDARAAMAEDLGDRIDEVKAALAALPPSQRALLSSVGAAPAAGPVAAVGHPAVDFALMQLGKPYEWGAEGPGSYDCSGLVQRAFATAGITLPRVSRDQSAVGVPVAPADVRAGDLVFYHRPVHHVALAIDGVRVVHAPTFGEPVKIEPRTEVGPVTVIRRVTR